MVYIVCEEVLGSLLGALGLFERFWVVSKK
jgi:hypothetical protein